MKLTRFCICLACLFVFARPALAAEADRCRENEYTIFVCPLENKKIVSVCALHDPARNAYGPAVYRYGTPDHVELTLPEDPNQFRKVASLDVPVSDKQTEEDEFIRFANRRFSYVVYDTMGDGFLFEGLAVFDRQKLLSNTHCRSYRPFIALTILSYIGVPEEGKTRLGSLGDRSCPPVRSFARTNLRRPTRPENLLRGDMRSGLRAVNGGSHGLEFFTKAFQDGRASS